MRDSNISVAMRIAAGIMGLVLLTVVLFSAFYIAAEADHDCSGEDCLICACIRQCENTLRGVGSGSAALISFIVPVILILLAAASVIAAAPQDTLVSIKVRLNN